jgi:predicted AAA+ superfamily ATPase
MPRTKRQNILLRHDQILGALEKAIDYLAELHDMFEPQHPEYAIGYKNILYMLAQAHEFVEQLKGHV